MKISITPTTYNKPSQLTFGEGKVALYSDFDRTYFPISHSGFKSIPKSDNDPLLKGYFERMGDFFGRLKEGMTFKITTGRNFDEFRTMAEMARDRNFRIPLPDALIVKNGGDEHPKIGSDEEFYKGGHYPYKYEVINEQKKSDLRKRTGWNGEFLKNKLKEVFTEYGFEVREPGTTNSANDYEFRSLFHDLYKNATDENPYPAVIALRRDGDSKIHITYPMNITHYGSEIDGKMQRMQDVMEGKVQKSLLEDPQWKEEIDKAGWDNLYWSDLKKGGIESEHHPAVEISPSLNRSRKPLTKLYDTQKAVEKALKENDLVIVAGDSTNDSEMLNIGNYFKVDESIKYPAGVQPFEDDVFKLGDGLVETLEHNPQAKKRLQELPIISIIVKNNDPKHKPPKIPKDYAKYGKVIEIEEGKLDEGIKQAIKMHADINPKYKEKLSPDLLKEIYGVVKDSGKKSSNSVDGSSIKKTKNKHTISILLGVGAITAIAGSYFYSKNKKKKQSQTNNKKE